MSMRSAAPPVVEADVCIIGSGPAGLSTAHALVAAGRSVVVLEAGSATPRSASEVLAPVTSHPDATLDLAASRTSAIGGTTNIWNTVRDGLAGAKYLPLDPLDLAPRPWLGVEGWPITHQELLPWYHAAQQLLQLGPFSYEPPTEGDAAHRLLRFPPGSLCSAHYRWGSVRELTAALRDPLLVAPTAQLLPATRAVELVLDRSGDRVTGVRCVRHGQAPCVVRADEVVVAAGAIENARLLLELDRPHAPTLGAGFMEHPIDRSLRLSSRDPALSPHPGYYHFARAESHGHLVGRIGLTAALQQTDELANASLRLFRAPSTRSASARRALAGMLGRAPTTHYRVALDLEQLPDPMHRLRLADARDQHGCRTAELVWRWTDADAARHMRLLAVLERELSRAGVTLQRGQPMLDPNAHHHAGMTAMHADERLGVVTPDLRVHNLMNVHVSGASVFPTAGVANPTLTIIALGLRLGTHLAHD